jgi:hypothetical protein
LDLSVAWRSSTFDKDNAGLTTSCYGLCMTEAIMTEFTDDSVEFVLREELARADELIVSAKQILRHLLTNDDRSIFSDAVTRLGSKIARNFWRIERGLCSRRSHPVP